MVVGGRELIDTLWNVNQNVQEIAPMVFIELIDTLWNVNKVNEQLGTELDRN